MLRLARTFVAGRFVQHQAGKFGIGPIHTIDRKYQAFDGNFNKGIGAKHAIYGDAFVPDH